MKILKSIKSYIYFQASITTAVKDMLSELEYKIKYENKKQWITEKTLSSTEKGVTSVKVADKEVVVSLTTYGKRRYEVYQAIESIMQGSVLPNRIILWLSDDYQDEPLPETLRRQCDRGLEIAFCKDLRSHTKLVYALERFPESIIITIDDDAMYQYDLIENLLKSYQCDKVAIWANRVDRLKCDQNGLLKSYMKRQSYVHSKESSPLDMQIGVEGVLYPPHSLADETTDSKLFLSLCPFADDVWFYAMALKNGTAVRHCYTHYERGAELVSNPYVQELALVHENDNPNQCRNDVQLKAVFEYFDLYKKLVRK